MGARVRLLRIFDSLSLVLENKQDYFSFYTKTYSKIVNELKNRKIYHVRATHMYIWKLSYGTAYFKANLKAASQEVFIKVQGPLLLDCFNNELVVNKYIDQTSEFLSRRKPVILDSFSVDDNNIIVYEYIPFEECSMSDGLRVEISEVLNEYKRIGVIHTDFGMGNIGKKGEKYYFLDYGTSICSRSNNLRLRLGPGYNHIDNITEEAGNYLTNPCYYYDDATHLGIERTNGCFLVGNDEVCYVRLGDSTKKYHVYKRGSLYFLTQFDDGSELN